MMRCKACSALLLAALLAGSLTACGTSSATADTNPSSDTSAAQAAINEAFDKNGFGSDGTKDKTLAAQTAALL